MAETPATEAGAAGEKRPARFKRFEGVFRLLILALIVLGLGRTPFLGNFLSWQTTFFHEISHGLAALASGGSLVKIELHFSGSGVCYTRGGLGWLISLAGYAGAAFWGLLIYLSALTLPRGYSHWPAVFLIALLAVSAVFYAADFQTRVIILALAALYGAAVKFRGQVSNLFLKLAGLYVLLDALKAPLALWRHESFNDAASLTAQTGLPAFIWIFFWLAAAAAGLVFIWKVETGTKAEPPV